MQDARRLESPHYAAGITEAVLVVIQAGGKSRGQRVSGIKVGADVIELRGTDGEVLAQSNIDAAAEGHGKCVRAIQRRRNAAEDGNADAG